MLSQHDRRALAEIEADLRASDPELARALDDGAAEPSHPVRRRRTGLAWLAVGAVLLATAFVVRSADLAFLAGGLILADLSVWIMAHVAARLRRRSSRPR